MSATAWLRLGYTSTWVRHEVLPEPDDLDAEDDEEDEDAEAFDLFGKRPFTTEQVDLVAFLVATSPGFGVLRTIQMRKDYVASEFPAQGMDEYWSARWAEAVSQKAEIGFNYAVLPLRVQAGLDEGKSEKTLAAQFNVTVARVQRAKGIELTQELQQWVSMGTEAVQEASKDG